MPNLKIAQIKVGHLEDQGGCENEHTLLRNFRLKENEISSPKSVRKAIEKIYVKDSETCRICSFPLLRLIQVL